MDLGPSRGTTPLFDRLVRWARMPRPAPGAWRRFVIIQIDGLSHAALEGALGRGWMPATARLVRDGRLRLHRVPVGLPTSTPAFQAGLMYGGPVDIPAFEFMDKRTGDYLWFPRPWAAARVEAAHAAGRRGIMCGGRTYGCIFGGGADDTVLTFAHLLKPAPRWGRLGVRARVVPLLVLLGVTAKTLALTAYEIGRWAGGALRDFSLGRFIVSPRGLLARRLIGGWLRELFTLSTAADIYTGVPALYVNYVDYDVAAHALGPGHRGARRTLRNIDASIRDIWRAARCVPDLRYDVFVLSDHGQTASVPFAEVGGPEPAAEMLLGIFQDLARRPPSSGEAVLDAAAPGLRPPRWPLSPVWQQNLAYLEPRTRQRNALRAGHLCIVPAGPNVNVYLMDAKDHVPVEAIEARYPGVLEILSRHSAVGVALARDAGGPVCYHRGVRIRIPPPPGPTGCPLFDRPDRVLVTEGLRNLLAMPSAGDIVLYGHYAPRGCVSYLGERGSHAGPAEDELYGFVLAPPRVAFDFGAVRGPADLHACFAAYGAGDRERKERND
jgi:Type I phosphodiesterase / nucleotide pyrophosphatase